MPVIRAPSHCNSVECFWHCEYKDGCFAGVIVIEDGHCKNYRNTKPEKLKEAEKCP